MKVTMRLNEMGGRALEKLEEVHIARHDERTHIAFILDESASMGSIKGPTVKAYNEQLKTIREMGAHDIRSYLVKFNQSLTRVLQNDPVSALYDMRDKDFRPNGGTALFDAIGETCSDMELGAERSPRDASKDMFLMIVISDGDDNMSNLWDEHMLRSRINRLKATGRWTFVLIGPKHMKDLMGDIGFDAQNILCVSQNLLPEAFEKSAHNLGKYLEARNAGGRLLSAYFD